MDGAPPISSLGAADSPVELIEGSLEAGVLFLCDHAANTLPKAYGTLGLAKEQLCRHLLLASRELSGRSSGSSCPGRGLMTGTPAMAAWGLRVDVSVDRDVS